MNEEQIKQYIREEVRNMSSDDIRVIIREELSELIDFNKVGKFVAPKHFQLLDGKNIQTGITTGTKIATATDQKVGFYGKAPVAQQSSITAASDLSTAIAAANSLITALENLGFIEEN